MNGPALRGEIRAVALRGSPKRASTSGDVGDCIITARAGAAALSHARRALRPAPIMIRHPESLIENVCESFQLVAGIVPQNVIIKYRV